MSITNQILQTIRKHQMIKSGDHICVALSGGCDSVALLLALQKLSATLEITLSAFHLHHGMRETADRDEDFVRALCKSKNIPLTVEHIDIPALTEQQRGSAEQIAREARYDCFEKLTAANTLVATAHHAQDAMETFFINLSRGSGLAGLCGIPYVRGRIIRPMLDVYRWEIEEYLAQQGQSYCHDETNDDPYYLRNFMRGEILAKLAARQDVDFLGNMKRTLSHLQQDEAYLEAVAAEALAEAAYDDDTYDVAKLAALPPPILRRALDTLTRQYADFGLDSVHFAALKKLLASHQGKQQLKQDCFVHLQNGRLFFGQGTRPVDTLSPTLLTQGEQTIGEKTISLFIENKKDIHKKFTHNMLDCDKIHLPLYARGRMAGDTFCHPKRHWTKSIKKMMTDDKITAPERANRLIVVDSSNRVVFVEGYGANAPFIPDGSTKQMITINIQTTAKERSHLCNEI